MAHSSKIVPKFVHHCITRVLLATALSATAAAAVTVPHGFQDSVVFERLIQPTAIRFAADGRVFVAEKRGVVKVFDGLDDPSPDVFVDLRTGVHNLWDRGLLGLELHPSFPATPYVYVLYTLDAVPGQAPPRWGAANANFDACPDPPGANSSGCIVGARLSRLEAAGNAAAGQEAVLLEDWCQQFPSHSIGDLAFGADGALYLSAGEGASFTNVDFGQFGGTGGVPLNPCGDPPAGVGGVLAPPTADGGALRSLDVRTAADPTTFDGTVLRIDPVTGAALPDNPLSGGGSADDDRIVAFGLRNPFRIAVRPETGELWLGDVGWQTWEEINRFASPPLTATNFGWPCYEGVGPQPAYDAANLTVCEDLYAAGPGAVAPPFYTYAHDEPVVDGDGCGTGSSSITGLAFYGSGAYPPLYQGALFFADYSRHCVWVMARGGDGQLDPERRLAFATGAGSPVDLQIGPGGDLFYVDLDAGTVHRVQFVGQTALPVASIATDVKDGPAPLTVRFDGSASSDPDGDPLTFAWDLDGDGAFDDSSLEQPVFTYPVEGTYAVQLRVSDSQGAMGLASATITVGPVPVGQPAATIEAPAEGTLWSVGEEIAFAGSAVDGLGAPLPAAALSWAIMLHHCAPDCHTHSIDEFVGVASGSFFAPDHDPSVHLEVRLTAQDPGGQKATRSVQLPPRTVILRFATVPSGLELVVGEGSGRTPFNRTVIVGSALAVSAPSPQPLASLSYEFSSWSDGGSQTRVITAPATRTTYVASYLAPCANDPGVCDDGNPCTDDRCDPVLGCVSTHNTAPCDDGQFCNGPDTCSDGTCRIHAGDPCIQDSECAERCDEATDTCGQQASGTPCVDDQNPCTEDACDQTGGCVHTPIPGCVRKPPTSPTPTLARLRCDAVRSGPFVRRLVTLGGRTVTVTRPRALCSPVTEDGTALATGGSLTCYRVKARREVKRLVEVRSALGAGLLRVGRKPGLLCVPSAPTASVSSLPSFFCSKAKPTSSFQRRGRKPQLLCEPIGQPGTVTGLPTLTCHRLKTGTSLRATVERVDEFGTQSLRIRRSWAYCVASE